MFLLNFYEIFGVFPASGGENTENKFKKWQYLIEDQ